MDELIQRYKERLKTVYSKPSPFYKNPLWEYSEIQQWIKKIEKITKKI